MKDFLLCPRCKKPIGLVGQIREWDKFYGEDAIVNKEFPIFINLFCESCDKPTVSIYIEDGGLELDPKTTKKLLKDIETLKNKKKKNNKR